MAKTKPELKFDDPNQMRGISPRFVISVLMMVLGIAWVLYFYLAVRTSPDPETGIPPAPGGPAFMADLGDWNYLIGFGLLFLGLIVAAHPSTPLGRGRGVVVGMLGCFVLGLIWICTFYVISNNVDALPIFNDLGQKNLIVGIAFMAVGFAYATRWE